MGAAYNILGKSVQPHWLAIGTIATVVGGVNLNSILSSVGAAPAPAATPAPAAAAPAAPAAPASGEFDVEKAINDFLASTEEKKAA